MKPKTLALLALFGGLCAAVVLFTGDPAPPAVDRLKIPGWKTDDVTKVEETPYAKVVIKKGGEEFVMARDEAAKDQWRLEAPLEAGAEGYRVRAVINLFRDELTALISQPLGAGDEATYGLDGDDAITLEVTGGDAPIKLVIGRADKADDDPESGVPVTRTWVQVPGQQAVHLIEGKDLRKTVDLPLADLRSKKFSGLTKWDAIDKVVIEDPTAAIHQRIVVERDATAAPAEKAEGDGAEGADAAPAKPEAWRFVEPAGLQLAAPRSFFSGLVNASATAFVKPAEVPAEAGLDDPAKSAKITVTAGDQVVTLRVGAEADGHGWVAVEGVDRERYKVSTYTRNQLLKSVGDLREKAILGIDDKAQVSRLEIRAKGKRALAITRAGDGWQRSDGAKADTAAVDSMVNALKNFRVAEFPAVPVTAANAGLTKAPLVIRFRDRDADRELHFGEEADSKVYARLGADGEIFRVSSWTRNQLDKSWEDLQNKEQSESKDE